MGAASDKVSASVVGGVRWMGSSQALRQAVQFVTVAALAHLVDPSAFGLFGMAAIFSGFVMQFRDLGLAAALVHDEAGDDQVFSSAFWVALAFGLVVFVVMILVSPLVQLFFDTDGLAPVLVVSAASLVFAAPATILQARMERAFEFKRVAFAETGASVVGALAALCLAFTGGGVWALVLQTVCASVVGFAALLVAGRWRPRVVYDLAAIRRIQSFGRDVTGFGLLNYWVRNADNLIVGRLLGSAALGAYSLAYRLMLFPIQNVTAVATRVAYPVLARGSDDPGAFDRAYLRLVTGIAFVTFPVTAWIFAMRTPLTAVLFGQQWTALPALLFWLAPVGMLQSVGATVGLVFQCKARTDLPLRWSLVTTPVYVLAFLVGAQWGTAGVAAAYAIVSVLLFVPGAHLALRLTGVTVGDMSLALAPTFAAALLAAAMGWTVTASSLSASLGDLGCVIASGLVSAVVYVFTSRFLQAEVMGTALGLLRGVAGRAGA